MVGRRRVDDATARVPQQVGGGAFTGWGALGVGTPGAVGTLDAVGDPAAILTPGNIVALYAPDNSGFLSGTSQSQPDGAFGTWPAIGN